MSYRKDTPIILNNLNLTLTIAHRQESLGNYDRIVEMQSGQIV